MSNGTFRIVVESVTGEKTVTGFSTRTAYHKACQRLLRASQHYSRVAQTAFVAVFRQRERGGSVPAPRSGAAVAVAPLLD